MRRRREFRGIFALRAFEGERGGSSLVSRVMRIKKKLKKKRAGDWHCEGRDQIGGCLFGHGYESWDLIIHVSTTGPTFLLFYIHNAPNGFATCPLSRHFLFFALFFCANYLNQLKLINIYQHLGTIFYFLFPLKKWKIFTYIEELKYRRAIKLFTFAFEKRIR